MSLFPRDWRRILVWPGLTSALCFVAAGCGDAPLNSGTAYSGQPPRQTAAVPDSSVPASVKPMASIADPQKTSGTQPVEVTGSNARPGEPATGSAADAQTPDEVPAGANPAAVAQPATEDAARPRNFVVEGPGDALRIGFDDLDLMKLINMDTVTPDCVEKMPAWLRLLDGKQVRIRGYMKPSGLSDGIPQFVFVRSTDLCCFGPKGKVYHLIAVKLKAGTTTDYIELKPFDVTGQFRIEKVELDDGLIFLLYHIDDAAIIRK